MLQTSDYARDDWSWPGGIGSDDCSRTSVAQRSSTAGVGKAELTAFFGHIDKHDYVPGFTRGFFISSISIGSLLDECLKLGLEVVKEEALRSWCQVLRVWPTEWTDGYESVDLQSSVVCRRADVG